MASEAVVDWHPDWHYGEPPQYVCRRWSMLVTAWHQVLVVETRLLNGRLDWGVYGTGRKAEVSELEARLWLTLRREEVEQKVRAKS